MDGTILNKKYKFEEKIAGLVDDCEDLDDRVTALENAPAPSGGLNYYVETHTAQESASFSHTFEHQPLAILQMVQPQTAVGSPVSIITPITFNSDGTLINDKMRIIRQNNQIVEESLSWNSATKTLTYTAADWDLAFNRANSKIAYISAEVPTPSTTRKKSKK